MAILLSSVVVARDEGASSRFDHYIDRVAWTQSADREGVLVFLGYRVGTPVCGKRLSDSAVSALQSNEDAVFGRACNRHIVLVRDSSTPANALDRRAVAAHEAFHSLVQYSVLRPRLDLVGFPGYPSEEDARDIESVARRLISVIAAGDQEATCSALLGVHSMSASARDYFLYRSYWEWPAEHYMRHSAFDSLDWADYLARRKAWSEGRGNPLYEAGVVALDQVESKIGRFEWQRKYMEGDSPISMVAAANGCPDPMGSSIQVDMRGIEIFVD